MSRRTASSRSARTARAISRTVTARDSVISRRAPSQIGRLTLIPIEDRVVAVGKKLSSNDVILPNRSTDGR